MTTSTASASPVNAQLERLARRRADAKMGWYLHALVYTLVNVGLAAIAVGNGQSWHTYPLLGWGLGLAIHGAAVWLLSPGAHWREQLVERERLALLRQQR